MARWTQEEEEKLLELYQTGHSYEEIAEALGRSTTSIHSKLKRLKKKMEKRPETTGPIYREEGGAPTEDVPEAQQIYDKLILTLLDDFDKIHRLLENLGKKYTKHKAGLYNNLCRMAEVLIKLLETKPEKASIEEWFDEIALTKLPQKAQRKARRVMHRWRARLRRLSKSQTSSAA